MTAAIRITGGRPQQTNFHQYAPLRLNAMPPIDIEIIESSAWPSGVGEKGVPGVAPAVVNAWFAASGERVRSLPWSANPLRL
jgi:isoquinoline 1-oxidoreductase beta subunit